MVPWSGPISSKHIAVKELAPILVAAAAWGSDWKGALVQVQCDNMAVVKVINNSPYTQLLACIDPVRMLLPSKLTCTAFRSS